MPRPWQAGAGNLTLTSRYGLDKARRMFRCRTCKTRFSERRGTPLFDSRLPSGKAESVLEHVAEGCGLRQTGRLCKVNCGTVGRRSRLAGAQARDLHDELVAVSPARARSRSMRSGPSSPSKEANCDRDDSADDREGDAWDHVAIDAESRLIPCVVPGERTAEKVAEKVAAIVGDMRRRTGGRLLDLITTDAYRRTKGRSSTPTARRSRRLEPATGVGPAPPTRPRRRA